MPSSSTDPGRSVVGAAKGAGRPSIATGAGAPVTATSTVRAVRIRSPPAVTSSSAASGRLPTNRPASPAAAASAAPERVTPMAA